MDDKPFLSSKELSKRWGISERTLERWRWLNEGPRFVKIGGRVRYRQPDVDDYETHHLQETLKREKAASGQEVEHA